MGIKIKNISEHEFVGKIVVSEDPMNLYRCRVKVLGLFDDLEDTMIPWCFPSATTTFGGSGAGSGSYPKVGTWVKVKFPHNDIYSGEYMGIPNMEPALADELEGDAINSHVFAYDVDETLKFMYTQAQGFIIQLGDEIINLKKEDGELHIVTTTKVFIETTDAEIVASAEIKLDAPKITVNGDHLVRWEEMQALFDVHQHVGNMGAPTGPPNPPNTLQIKVMGTKTDMM